MVQNCFFRSRSGQLRVTAIFWQPLHVPENHLERIPPAFTWCRRKLLNNSSTKIGPFKSGLRCFDFQAPSIRRPVKCQVCFFAPLVAEVFKPTPQSPSFHPHSWLSDLSLGASRGSRFRRRVLLKAMGIFQRQDVGEGN